MAWHGYLRLTFTGVYGSGVSDKDKEKVAKGLDALVTDAGKTKIMPQHALQTLWAGGDDEVIIEAQFKSKPDKSEVVLVLVPELGLAIETLMSFEVFEDGAGKDDWKASRDACLEYIEANREKWRREV